MDRCEGRLVDRLKQRDVGAQRELYDIYAGRLLSIALRYVGRRDAAEDTVHDVFIKVFASVKDFNYRGDGSLRAWIERIAINASLEWLRKAKKLETVSYDEGYLATKMESPEPSTSDMESVPHDVILRLITELPDGYRAVFNLYAVEGYPHKEIARRLGINEKSSSSQLLRAKRMLAAKINKYIKEREVEGNE